MSFKVFTASVFLWICTVSALPSIEPNDRWEVHYVGSVSGSSGYASDSRFLPPDFPGLSEAKIISAISFPDDRFVTISFTDGTAMDGIFWEISPIGTRLPALRLVFIDENRRETSFDIGVTGERSGTMMIPLQHGRSPRSQFEGGPEAIYRIDFGDTIVPGLDAAVRRLREIEDLTLNAG
jgi:predicted ester cyclase